MLGIDPIGSASASMAPLGSYAPGRGVGEGVSSRYLLASSVEGEMVSSGHQSEMQLRGSESKGVVYQGRWMAGLLDSNEAGGNRIPLRFEYDLIRVSFRAGSSRGIIPFVVLHDFLYNNGSSCLFWLVWNSLVFRTCISNFQYLLKAVFAPYHFL